MLTDLKQKVSRLELVPSEGGKFEVTIDGRLVFSKLAQKRFPEYKEVKDGLPLLV